MHDYGGLFLHHCNLYYLPLQSKLSLQLFNFLIRKTFSHSFIAFQVLHYPLCQLDSLHTVPRNNCLIIISFFHCSPRLIINLQLQDYPCRTGTIVTFISFINWFQCIVKHIQLPHNGVSIQVHWHTDSYIVIKKNPAFHLPIPSRCCLQLPLGLIRHIISQLQIIDIYHTF